MRGKPRTYGKRCQRAVQSRVGAYILRARIQSTSGNPDLAGSPARVPPTKERIYRRYGACPVRRFPGEASCIPGEASCGASPAPTESVANAPFNHGLGLTSSAPASRAPAATPTWPVRRRGCPPRRNESTVGTGLAPYGAFPVKSRAFPARHRAGQAPHLRSIAPTRRSITGRGYVLRARVQGASGDPDLAGSPERVPPTRERICRRYGACPVRRFPGEASCIPGKASCGGKPRTHATHLPRLERSRPPPDPAIAALLRIRPAPGAGTAR